MQRRIDSLAALKALALLAALCGLAACGGGGDATPAAAPSAPTPSAPPPPPPPPPSPPAADTLTISAATPATWNGGLALANVQFEHGSSDQAATQFQATQPYCRVALYGLVNSGTGQRYFLEIPFRKTDREIGLVKFGDDATLATLARVLQPTSGIGIDTTLRRITFNGLVVGAPGSAAVFTIDGSITYPSNVDASNRAACG
jgi:hypothetical protein